MLHQSYILMPLEFLAGKSRILSENCELFRSSRQEVAGKGVSNSMNDIGNRATEDQTFGNLSLGLKIQRYFEQLAGLSIDSQPGCEAAITRRGFLGFLPAVLASLTWLEQGPQWAEALVLRPLQPKFPNKKLVWVVDDEPALREMYRLVLGSAGCLTRVFEDRAKALEVLAGTGQPPAVLITDFIGYPISADRFMQLCRVQHPQIKILMATGCHRDCLEDCGAKPDRFLQKPFGLESLLTEVEGLLGRCPAEFSKFAARIRSSGGISR